MSTSLGGQPPARSFKRRKLSASPEAEGISNRSGNTNGVGNSSILPGQLTKSSILAVQVQQLLSETKSDAGNNAALSEIYQEAIQSCPGFSDSSRLASIWLQQRGMGSTESQGGFGITEWNSLCALLLMTGVRPEKALLSSRYSAAQLFRATLQFIATKDLTLSMTVRSKTTAPRKASLPVLYDGATQQNLFSKMSPWSYQDLRDEATLTLAALNAENEDNFDEIFRFRPAESLLKFDAFYQAELPPGILSMTIFETITQGLGDRAKRVNITTSDPKNSSKNSKNSRQRLNIGLMLNSSNVDRLIDHGPSAEDTEAAAKFRKFWGTKAELRRFRDGSISESLVWSEDSPMISQILEYLFQHHFHIPSSALSSFANQLDNFIIRPQDTLTPAVAFKLFNTAYQTLTTQLYALEDLPLRIRSITPADGQLSSSSLIPPLSNLSCLPADIFISFENSTRWPDHLPAIQHTKIAFLLKLGEAMLAAHPEITTRVGLEESESVSTGYMNTSYLDIIYPPHSAGLPPLSFRLRIQHEREITLLEKAIATNRLQPEQTLLAKALHTQKSLLALQKHTTALRLLTTRFPALSATIRLLKNWASSHLLPPTLVLPPILDLLAVHTFTHPTPWGPPASSQTAFLRTLHTISTWDWAATPLLIDTSQDNSFFTSDDTITNLQTRFRAWRKLDPHLHNVVLFIGTNLDPTGVIWTQNGRPPRVVAARLTALARASLTAVGIIETQKTEKKNSGSNHIAMPEWNRLFQTPIDGVFDFLIHLNIGFGRVGNETGRKEKIFKNLKLQEEELDEENIGFDPAALYLRDLEATFGGGSGGNVALFFHDQDGGKLIAGLWNPKVTTTDAGEKEFRVRLGWNSRPVFGSDDGDDNGEEEKEGRKAMVGFNAEAVLAEMAGMGEGIVKRIDVKEVK